MDDSLHGAWSRFQQSTKPLFPEAARRPAGEIASAVLFSIGNIAGFGLIGAALFRLDREQVKEKYCEQFARFTWLIATEELGLFTNIPQNLAPQCRQFFGTNQTIANLIADRPRCDLFSLSAAGPFPLPGTHRAPWQTEAEQYQRVEFAKDGKMVFSSLGIQAPTGGLGFPLYTTLALFGTVFAVVACLGVPHDWMVFKQKMRETSRWGALFPAPTREMHASPRASDRN